MVPVTVVTPCPRLWSSGGNPWSGGVKPPRCLPYDDRSDRDDPRMPDSPTTLAVTLVPMQEVLGDYGLDFRDLAQRCGIDPDLPTRPDARDSVARLQKLWHLASQESGDPLFGLRVGQRARPAVFHALGLGILSSTSLLAALQRVERYCRVISTNGRLVVCEHGPVTSLEGRRGEGGIQPAAATVDAAAVVLCRLFALCAGPAGTPRRVRLPHPPPSDCAPYNESLGCPVEYDAPSIDATSGGGVSVTSSL